MLRSAHRLTAADRDRLKSTATCSVCKRVTAGAWREIDGVQVRTPRAHYQLPRRIRAWGERHCPGSFQPAEGDDGAA